MRIGFSRRVCGAVALALGLGLLGGQGRAESIIKSGDVVAIIGDSITEQRIYSVYVEDYLLMCQPVRPVRGLQFGWGGEASWDLMGRIQNDVVPFKPTVATLNYGMNDGRYGPSSPEMLKHYRESITSVIEQLKKAGVREIVLGTPGCVDPAKFRVNAPKDQTGAAAYNQTLADISAVAKEVAKSEGIVFADLHQVMLDATVKAEAKYGPGYFVTMDGIHPLAGGHLVMAYVYLKAMGFDGAIGTITLDMKANTATGTEGQNILSAANGTVEVESTRYPFCFTGVANDPGGTLGMTEFIPFNQELNRYLLVVHNAPGQKLKVTWGKTSKEFSAADLEQGINLAAEFADNPFRQAFATVEGRIASRQGFELTAVRGIMHQNDQYKQYLGGDDAVLQQFDQATVALSAKLGEAAGKAVVPVKHEIKVEVVN